MRQPMIGLVLLLFALRQLPLAASSADPVGAASRPDRVKVGALSFAPPNGWTPTRATSRVVLAFAPPDLPKGTICQVRVYADEVSKEAFSAWFMRRWSALMGGKPSLRTSEVLTQKVGPVDLMVRSGAYAESGGESYSLILAAAVEGHYVLAAYDANDFALIEKHQEEVYAIFETMQIEGVGKAPGDAVPPKPAPGEPAAPKPAAADPASPKPPANVRIGSKPNRGPAARGLYQTGDAKQESARISRLSEIARLLQDSKSDTPALVTEAVRLCGFSICSEERVRISEPLGAPRLMLSVTDIEIREFSELFRRRHTVALNDVIGMVDVVYKGIGSEPSCGPMVLEWLENGGRSGSPSVRALTSFIQFLGAFRGGGSASVFVSGAETLDPIQSLLILRVVTEEIGGALRKAMAKERPVLELASRCAALQEGEASGAAEDGYVGGVTGLWDSISDLTGKGEAYAKKAGKANAILSILKFIATYVFLKGEVRVDAPGQPLVRTKDRDAGEVRKIIARFWIDGARVTDWMKDHRTIVALAGLDLDMPKTGALKGVPTEWKVDQDHLVSTQLIQTTRGGPALNDVETDAKGEAKVDWEGCPQPVALDPKKVMPLNKQVWITVTPQVKEVKVQQDLVDAVTGAIGIRGGPAGFVGPLMEMLYRMKWKGEAYLLLNVRDWQPGESIGQLKAETQASWTEYGRNSALRMTLNRQLVYTDVGMNVVGGDVVQTIDPKVFANQSPEFRKQVEAGMKGLADLAKKRQFIGMDPGTTHMSINDLLWSRAPDACDPIETTTTATWNGATTRDYASGGANHDMFQISVDLEKKIASVLVSTPLKVKYVSITKQGRITGQQDKIEDMGIFSGLTLLPPFDKGGAIEIPLKETKIIESDETNYYGAVSIPYTFGPGNRFKDNFILSYSVTRKVPKKK